MIPCKYARNDRGGQDKQCHRKDGCEKTTRGKVEEGNDCPWDPDEWDKAVKDCTCFNDGSERYSGLKMSRGAGMNEFKNKLVRVLKSAEETAAKGKFHDSAKKYKQWIKEVEQNHVTSEDLKKWLLLQIDYWGQKDREYATYLKELANGKV